MSPALEWPGWLAGAAGVAGGLTVPGFCLLRAAGRPGGWLAAFLGSLAVLLNVALLLDTSGAGLRPAALAAGVAAASALLAGVAWARQRREGSSAPATGGTAKVAAGPLFSWWWLPAGIGAGAILYRAWVDPLSGYDHVIRWDFLAKMLWEHGTLAFYPPVRGEDFVIYGWCDGIPPLVSLLHFWSYACFGGIAPLFTFPRLAMETLMLFGAVAFLAEVLAGRRGAGPVAMALLACSPLVLWSVAIGQETGLTALSLVAMLAFLLRGLDEGGDGRGFFEAGVAAGVGALAREYGLAWTLLGLFALLCERRSSRDILRFFIPAVCVAAPWYLRNWALTGSPLWSHELGVFPVNQEHASLMNDVALFFGVQGHWGAFGETLAKLPPVLGVALPLAGWVALRGARRVRWPLVGAAMVFALWLWSLHQTAAGWDYAMRVLSPAIAAIAAAGAVAWAGLEGRKRALCVVLVVLCASDSAVRSLHLPVRAPVTSLGLGGKDWRASSQAFREQAADPVWSRIAKAAEGRSVLSYHSYVAAYFAERGVSAHPGVSPAVDFLRDKELPLSDMIARLRAMGVRFVFFPVPNPVGDLTAARTPFWSGLVADYAPAAEFYALRVYDLDSLAPRPGGYGAKE